MTHIFHTIFSPSRGASRRQQQQGADLEEPTVLSPRDQAAIDYVRMTAGRIRTAPRRRPITSIGELEDQGNLIIRSGITTTVLGAISTACITGINSFVIFVGDKAGALLEGEGPIQRSLAILLGITVIPLMTLATGIYWLTRGNRLIRHSEYLEDELIARAALEEELLADGMPAHEVPDAVITAVDSVLTNGDAGTLGVRGKKYDMRPPSPRPLSWSYPVL